MELIKYLPSFYLNSEEVTNIQAGLGSENDKMRLAIQDILNQIFVSTATWGLKYWEEMLTIDTDESKPYEFRRSVVKAKLRGAGTVTVSLIKNVAESFSNGQVDINENVQPYTFEVKFIGTRGIPPNLDDLKKVINEIKPAHLAVLYKFTYITWDEFDNYNKTWDGWDNLNLTWDDFEKYREVI